MPNMAHYHIITYQCGVRVMHTHKIKNQTRP